MLELWVVWSVLLPSSSSQFICKQMWDHPVLNLPPRQVHQPLPCYESSPPGCPSPPLLLVWMNVCSLTPWLLDFHTVQFSVSSGCFLFLNLCCPSFGCARRHRVSTYASILAGSPMKSIVNTPLLALNLSLSPLTLSFSQRTFLVLYSVLSTERGRLYMSY